MKIFKRLLLGVVLVVLLLGGFLLKTLYDAGEFREIRPRFQGNCVVVGGVLSSEDITVHPRTGVAFISSDDRRPAARGEKGRQGAIVAYDLTAPDPRPIPLTAGYEGEFHPHGIGLLVGQEGSDRLFVVNHRSDGHFVEIFDFTGDRLIHRESIGGSLMHSPNDVVPVGPRSFYATNDHGSAEGLGRTLEEYLQLARSNVVYYDGERFWIVAEGLAYANGVMTSADGRTVYVAATVGREVRAYDRDPDSGALALKVRLDVGTGIDNIERDAEGDLWAGCHPRLLTFVKYAKDPGRRSPSQVIRIHTREGVPVSVREMYLSAGEPLSGASVAAPFRDRLVIGSVFDPRFLVCTMP